MHPSKNPQPRLSQRLSGPMNPRRTRHTYESANVLLALPSRRGLFKLVLRRRKKHYEVTLGGLDWWFGFGFGRVPASCRG